MSELQKSIKSHARTLFFGNSEKLGWKQWFRAYILLSIIISIVGLVLPFQSSQTVSNTTIQVKPKASSSPTISKPTPKVSKVTAKADASKTFENSKQMKNGGFTTTEIAEIRSASKVMNNYVYLHSSYVAGVSTLAALQVGCNIIGDAYPSLRPIGSDSAYFEDLLDRAKDYFYEAKSLCSHGFRRNRIDELYDSSRNAAIAKGFFDRILNEKK